MTDIKKHVSYGTISEIEFIKGIGMWSNIGLTKGKNRVQLLKGYIKGIENRELWGAIKKEEVMKFAKEALRQATL